MPHAVDMSLCIIVDVGLMAVVNLASGVTPHLHVATHRPRRGIFCDVQENVPGGIDMRVALCGNSAAEIDVHEPLVLG